MRPGPSSRMNRVTGSSPPAATALSTPSCSQRRPGNTAAEGSIPAEILAGRAKVRLFGFGELKAGETEDGKTTFTIPEAAKGEFPANYAWVFELGKSGS